MVKDVFRCLARDVRVGLPATIVGSVAAFAIAFVALLNNQSEIRNFYDAAFMLFEGCEPPVPETPFHSPIGWICLMYCPAFVISFYPRQDLVTQGAYCLTRTGSWYPWLISKALWAFLNITLVIVIYIIAIEFSLLTCSSVYELGYVLAMPINGDAKFFIDAVLVLYALGIVAFVLALWINPIASSLVVVISLIAACYLPTPWLIGNYAMSTRIPLLVHSIGAFDINAVACFLIIGASLLVCIYRLPKRDVLFGGSVWDK